MNKRIKYFTYHGCEDTDKYRFNSPAADTKVDYIISVLNRCGYGVDQISRASSGTRKYLKGYIESSGNNTLRFFASLGVFKYKFWIFNMLFMDIQFFIWCLFNLKKNEQIIVYHSLGYTRAFILLKKIRKIRIVGEIEEIYQDVHYKRKSIAKKEYEFISICDKYIFPTQLLDIKLNTNRKPTVVVHGVYSAGNNNLKKKEDGKIHVVYGGTLDPTKGCGDAAYAAALLPPNYHVHICGFDDSTEIVKIIKEVSSKTGATLTFEGNLKGKDYTDFLQKCHIGLCPQDPKAAYNLTSFPSKILVYLSYGLKVVSIRIPAISESSVSKSLFFYDDQNPEELSKAIINCNNQKSVSGQEILKQLDSKFESDLLNLIKV